MKAEPDCKEVRYRLTLELSPEDSTLRQHLAACDACRAEAAWVAGLSHRLSGSAVVDPGSALDAAIRSLFSSAEPLRRPFRRASMAAMLAGLGFFSLVLGLGTILAQIGAAQHGLTLSVILATSYLAVSVAALTPLLIFARVGRPVAQNGVGR